MSPRHHARVPPLALGTVRTGRVRAIVVAALAVSGLIATGCGDGDGTSAATTTTPTTTTTEVATTAEPSTSVPADPTTTSPAPVPPASIDDRTGDGEGPVASRICRGDEAPSGVQFRVTGSDPGDPDAGLVARMLPDPSADPYGTLTEGTVVDTFVEADSCVVASDGTVWWNIGTPELATGGWVDSHSLERVGDEQDAFDLETTQVACVYRGDSAACDLLATFGYADFPNYGLGNSLSQAPATALDEDCAAGDALACAELDARG